MCLHNSLWCLSNLALGYAEKYSIGVSVIASEQTPELEVKELHHEEGESGE